MRAPSSACLTRITQGPGDRLVVAFPPAGAGPSIFRRWGPSLPCDVELLAFLAPGRESRTGEPPETRAEPLVSAAVEALLQGTDRPLTLYGHSLGALLAREVARMLPADRVRSLVVAAAAPPHVQLRDLSRASDEELVGVLRGWGGTPEVVLEDEEVYRAYLPTLRADFEVGKQCRRPCGPTDLITAPVLALAGTDDDVATPSACLEWRAWTTAEVQLHVVAGGHFFPFEQAGQLWRVLGSHLSHSAGPS